MYCPTSYEHKSIEYFTDFGNVGNNGFVFINCVRADDYIYKNASVYPQNTPVYKKQLPCFHRD